MKNLFSVQDKVIVITGAAGVLGTSMVHHFAEQGAKVVILDRNEEAGRRLEEEVKAEGGEVMFLYTDVLDKQVLEGNYTEIMARYGRIDVLINGAGGNMAGATIAPDKTIFDLDIEAVRKVVDLNLFWIILPTMTFTRAMIEQKQGSIINISSESAIRPLTRVAGYGVAKAAVTNFTKYMCGELATKYGDGLRVNAIAPGFFITEQNAVAEPGRKLYRTVENDPRAHALRPFRRTFGAARHAAMARERRIEIRFGHDDRDRRRFRRLLDLIGPGHHSARRESGQHDNPKTIRDMQRPAAQIH